MAGSFSVQTAGLESAAVAVAAGALEVEQSSVPADEPLTPEEELAALQTLLGKALLAYNDMLRRDRWDEPRRGTNDWPNPGAWPPRSTAWSRWATACSPPTRPR